MAAAAQAPVGGGRPALPVVKCSPDAGACTPQAAAPAVALPDMGPEGRATVLSPNLRSTELALEPAEYDVLIPGCAPDEPGVFTCDSVHQFQHCRTLMYSSFVHSCRAPNPLEDGLADARPAAAGEFALEIDSNARVRVSQGYRGFGQARGDADVSLHMRPPVDASGAACLQRDQFLFYPTGPKGGVSRIDSSGACDEPMKFSFEPHEDDIVRAYDACENFAAWGSKIDGSITVIAAGLFHLRSSEPAFVARHSSGVAVVAPYVAVTAPLSIDCAD